MMFLKFFLLLNIFSIVVCEVAPILTKKTQNYVRPILGLKNGITSNNKCIFIGCSCNKQLIECPTADPKDGIKYKLTMFPKRYNGKSYFNNITLNLYNNELEKIPDDRFAGLDMFKIDLSNNQIFKLSPDMFRDIKRLEILELNKNALKFLNIRLFEPIKNSLNSLNLDENNLNEMQTSMLSKVFADFPSLRQLKLSKNKLTYIPNFTKLNITRLVLSSNNINMLVDPETYLSLLPTTLIYLDLENNYIKQINDYSFSNLNNLEELNLATNKITVFAENSFTNLKKLRILNLSQNNLMHIPSRIFYTLANLEDINFSRQTQLVKQIDDYAFDRLSNQKPIKRIDLSHNRIANMQNRAFCSKNSLRPYANIKEIDLAYNSIKKLNSCIMRQLTKGYKNRVTIKTTPNSQNDKSILIECDCEITRINKLLDLHGSCQLPDSNFTILSKNYDCGIDVTVKTLNQVNSYCNKLTQYECSLSPDLELYSSEIIITSTISYTSSKNNSSLNSNTTDQNFISTLPIDRNSTSFDTNTLKENIENSKNDTLKSSSSNINFFTYKIFYLSLLVYFYDAIY